MSNALGARPRDSVAGRIDPACAPIAVVDIDVEDGRVSAAAGRGSVELRTGTAVWGLVRLHRRPMGVICAQAGAGADPHAELVAEARSRLGSELSEHLAQDEARVGDAPACVRRRARLLVDPPLVSVIVATRHRPSQLAACLDSLLRLEYPKVEIIVVDNDPDDTATESLVTERYAGKVVYTIERARGLASAHNRGVLAAHGRILAFTDDDVVVDADWASALVEAFRANPRAGCVTGLILPAQLETRPQAMLERRGGFAKGFRLAEHSDRVPGTHPLFPFTAGRLGSGANMAFTAEALHRIGGFDRTLGAGTCARGGDDLLAFFRTAAAGRSVVYQPAALVWHHHRREPRALADQAYGYGVGLGAYLTAALVNEPRMIVPLLRKLPRGAAYALRNSRADQSDPAAWPARLARLERYGLCYGPIAYGRSRWKARGVGRGEGSA